MIKDESFIKQMTQIMKDTGVRIEFRFDSVLNCLDVYIMKHGRGGYHFMMSDEAVTADRDPFLDIESPENMMITNLEAAIRAICKREKES